MLDPLYMRVFFVDFFLKVLLLNGFGVLHFCLKLLMAQDIKLFHFIL